MRGLRFVLCLLALGPACAADDVQQGTASGGPGPCSHECELDSDCPEQTACFEVGGDACGFECEAVECTRNEHCGDGICSFAEDAHEYVCLPASCAGATKAGFTRLDSPASIAALAEIRCVHGNLDASVVSSLAGLAQLERVTGVVFVHDNPELAALDGLDGLVAIDSLDLERNAALADLDALHAGLHTNSVYIEGNPALPAQQIASLLERIAVEPYSMVLTCGNLDDAPCDPGT